MNIDEQLRRSNITVQAEADQLDALLVDEIAKSDERFARFIELVRAVTHDPEVLRVLLPSDLDPIAYLFTGGAVRIINAARERRRELKQGGAE
jgi:type IV secretory pathway TrbF-like protein